MSRPESVSSSTGQGGLQYRHLEDLVALLFAAGESLVDAAAHELLAHLHETSLFLDHLHELDGVYLRPRHGACAGR